LHSRKSTYEKAGRKTRSVTIREHYVDNSCRDMYARLQYSFLLTAKEPSQ
jgi:hypothetical protein